MNGHGPAEHAMLCGAIRDRRLVSFRYRDGHPRVVEPHLLGRDARGHVALSAWLVRGASASGDGPGWRVYHVSVMREITVLPDPFQRTRPGYNPNDTTMQAIICRV